MRLLQSHYPIHVTNSHLFVFDIDFVCNLPARMLNLPFCMKTAYKSVQMCTTKMLGCPYFTQPQVKAKHFLRAFITDSDLWRCWYRVVSEHNVLTSLVLLNPTALKIQKKLI